MSEDTVDHFCPSCGESSSGGLCDVCSQDLTERHEELYNSAALLSEQPSGKARSMEHFSQGEIVQFMLHLALHEYNYSTTSAEYGVPIRYLKYWSNSADIERPIGPLIERAIEKLLLKVPAHEFPREWADSLTALIKQWVVIQEQMYKRTELLLGMSTDINLSQLTRVVNVAERMATDVEFVDVDSSAGS